MPLLLADWLLPLPLPVALLLELLELSELLPAAVAVATVVATPDVAVVLVVVAAVEVLLSPLLELDAFELLVAFALDLVSLQTVR